MHDLIKKLTILFYLLVVAGLFACSVKLETPDKPIVIDMNVKVQQEVHVKVAKDVEDSIVKNPNVF